MSEFFPLPQLVELANHCREIATKAKADLGDDLGHSLLDLVADQIPDIPLRVLEDALVVAGLRPANTDRERRYNLALRERQAAYGRMQAATTDGEWLDAQGGLILWHNTLQLVAREGQPLRIPPLGLGVVA